MAHRVMAQARNRFLLNAMLGLSLGGHAFCLEREAGCDRKRPKPLPAGQLNGQASASLEQLHVLTVALLFQVGFGNKAQGGRVHAVAQPCGLRTVVEHMAQV